MQNPWLDLRYALKGLFRSPLFAAVAIGSMGIGIGANTAVFSVFNALLLRPFPYTDPGALVAIYETSLTEGSGLFTVSPPDFLTWRGNATTLQASAAYRGWTPNLTGIDQAERLTGVRVSGDFFGLLGVVPVAGRALAADDERNAARTVAISEALWRRRFGADPGIAGRAIRLDGESHTIAGVMPRSLQFPASDIDVWAPLNLDKEQNDRGEHSLLAIGRMKRGVSRDQAVAELRGMTAAHKAESNGHVPALSSLREWFVSSSSRTVLWGLLGAVGLLLLMACANVANLLFARGGARARELMVRTAIGASRGRLVAQLLTESLLLAAIAGAVGLLIAVWSIEALGIMLPQDSPFAVTPMTLDWRVLGYLFIISLTAGVLFGGLPALKYSRVEFTSTRVNMRAPSSYRVERTLLVAQTALAVTLLAGAGLLTRGFLDIWRIDPGFTAGGVMTARVSLPPTLPRDSHAPFFARVIEQLAASPDVTAAAAVTHVPMSGIGNSGYITIAGRESLSENPATRPGAARFVVTADYFRALGIPAVQGRVFTNDDGPGSPPVVIVNEAMARRYWPGESPVGRRIKRGTPAAPFAWLTIVGVVPDVRQLGLGGAPGPMVYLPLPQSPESSMTLVLKSPLPDADAAARIRSAVRAVDRDQPVALVRALDEIVFGSVSGRWVPMMWMGVFAGLALVLASLGVYGVVSYAIQQRRREFGIRLALGAKRADLVRLAVRQGVGPALVGAGLGMVAAVLLARIGSTLFAGAAAASNAPTLLAAAALLAVLALAASYGPARRIADEDAALTLRTE
jgi:putative ABC transport system permease protein